MTRDPIPEPLRLSLTADLAVPVDPVTGELTDMLAESFGPTTRALLHYGSRAQGRKPRADSAYDYFAIVDDNRAAYESLRDTVGTSYSAGMATALASRLPPNVIAVSRIVRGEALIAKCCVISTADWQHACSPAARDHFCHGRLMQVARLVWARDDETRDLVGTVMAGVRAHTFAWSRPILPAEFTGEEYLVAMVRRSLAGEIRPETGDHARTLVESQVDELGAIYRPLLDARVADGALVSPRAGVFSLARPVPAGERSRWAWYFRRSKARTTVRLFKHVALFENWLDYIVRKLERSGNAPVELTPRERRWPLIFLWPRFFRFLRTRSQRQQ